MKLRPAFLRVHRWVGLTLGLVVMAITVVFSFLGGLAFRRGFKTTIGQPDKTEWPRH